MAITPFLVTENGAFYNYRTEPKGLQGLPEYIFFDKWDGNRLL